MTQHTTGKTEILKYDRVDIIKVYAVKFNVTMRTRINEYTFYRITGLSTILLSYDRRLFFFSK